MKKSISCVLLLLSTYAFAQFGDINSVSGNSGISDRVANGLVNELGQLLRTKSPSVLDSDVDGSVFIDPQYRTAKIIEISGVWPVRYDAFRDEMEVKKENEVFALKKDPTFNELTFTDKNEKVILVEYNFDKERKTGYLFLVDRGSDYSLLKKETVIFKKGKEARTTLEISSPNRFVKLSPTYFLKKEQSAEFIQLDKKANNLIAAHPEKKDAIKSCWKKTNLDLTKESSVKDFAKCLQ